MVLSVSTSFLFGQTVSLNQASPKTSTSAVDGGAGSASKTTKAKPNTAAKPNVKTVNKKKRKTTQVTTVRTPSSPKKTAK